MTDKPLQDLDKLNDEQQPLDARVKHDPVSTAEELLERNRQEIKDQKSPNRPPKFVSRNFGRLEILAEDGSALVKGVQYRSEGEAAYANGPDARVERTRVNDQTDKLVEQGRMTPDQRKTLERDMDLFEKRAPRDNLSKEEVAKTYEQVSRMLDSSSNQPVKDADRIKAALQVVHQAGDPTCTDQGQHGTCNITALENRMYTRSPSDVARAVADVSLTGQYRTADGTVIRPDVASLQPDSEAAKPVRADGDRSYASQLFQVTAINAYWNRQDRDPSGNPVSKGDIRYEQRAPGEDDLGERLLNFSTHPPTEIRRDDALGFKELNDINRQITGRNEEPFMVERDVGESGDYFRQVKNLSQLQVELQRMKDQQLYPATFAVNVGMEPFWSDQGGSESGPGGGWHIIAIKDYDPKTGMATIDNQWGSKNDHTVSARDLFLSLQEPHNAVGNLKYEVSMNRANGHVDGSKELELLRMKAWTGEIDEAKYDSELIHTMQDNIRRWHEQNASGILDKAEMNRTWRAYSLMLGHVADAATRNKIQQAVGHTY